MRHNSNHKGKESDCKTCEIEESADKAKKFEKKILAGKK